MEHVNIATKLCHAVFETHLGPAVCSSAIGLPDLISSPCPRRRGRPHQTRHCRASLHPTPCTRAAVQRRGRLHGPTAQWRARSVRGVALAQVALLQLVAAAAAAVVAAAQVAAAGPVQAAPANGLNWGREADGGR